MDKFKEDEQINLDTKKCKDKYQFVRKVILIPPMNLNESFKKNAIGTLGFFLGKKIKIKFLR